ncbi:MAG: hypothetical protein ACW98X_27690, partial [Promethearchaeota archaeon]
VSSIPLTVSLNSNSVLPSFLGLPQNAIVFMLVYLIYLIYWFDLAFLPLLVGQPSRLSLYS